MHYIRDKVRNSVTREEYGVEPLLRHVEVGHLGLPGYLIWMLPGSLAGKTAPLGWPVNVLGSHQMSWRK